MQTVRHTDNRILVLTPNRRDERRIVTALEGTRMTTVACQDTESLVGRLDEGAAAALIAQEALCNGSFKKISTWLKAQPPWSDMPLVVLTSGPRSDPAVLRTPEELELLGNVTLIERPMRSDTIRCCLRAALRARSRQHEARRHRESLIRAQRDLEQFAHSASHDLREPLRTVSIFSEFLSSRYGPRLDEEGLLFLSYLRSASSRMEMLVHDLLAYMQATGLDDEASVEICASNQLRIALQHLDQDVAHSAVLVTHDPLPLVRMKPVHLQQIFLHLIGNAIKYRANGAREARVHISATAENGFWRFAVADNGIGIEPQFQEQIFGIFKRLHTADKFPGTGIGLAICQKIVERYGGTIRVRSELDQGSTFFFTLPS